MLEHAVLQLAQNALLRHERHCGSAHVQTVEEVAATSPIFCSGSGLSGSTGVLYLAMRGTSFAVVKGPPPATQHAEEFQVMTSQDHLLSLQKDGLSVSNLAAILGVSRPTIYSWMEGNIVPNVGKQDRIEQIYKALSQLGSPQVKMLSKVWLKRHDVDVPSLYESLTSATLNLDAIEDAVEASRPMLEKLTDRATRPRKSVAKLADETLAVADHSSTEWDQLASAGREWPGDEKV